MEKREAMKKYFAPYPSWASKAIWWGLILIPAYGLGLLIIAFAIYAIWNHFNGNVSDSQIDVWTEEDLSKLQARALEKMGTDASELVAEHVIITGPRFWDSGGVHAGFRDGKDGVKRFTPVGVTIINFTQNQLLSYSCAVDLTTGNPINEATDEYFYKDVVSVQTQSKTHTLSSSSLPQNLQGTLAGFISGGQLQLSAAETFSLTTAGGNSMEVVLRNDVLNTLGQVNIPLIGRFFKTQATIPIVRAEKAIQVVRKMLRDKKSA